MSKKNRRGIYLISTLLLLTFLVMVGGAVMVSFQQGLASSGTYNNRQMALQAALSGLQYIEARLESNALSFTSLDPAARRTYQTAEGALQITERGFSSGGSVRGWNVCGYMTNGNVASATEGRVYTLFRASFNTDFSTFYAQPSDWSQAVFDGTTYTLPTIPYVSTNLLLRPSTSTGYSYTADGSALQKVPGGTADLIVEGMVISPTGVVLARRVVESIVSLKSAGALANASSAAGSMGMEVLRSGGTVTVSAADPTASWAHTSGLAALQNIRMYGVDPVGSGTTPPGYTSGALANLGDATRTFTYTKGNTPSQDFTGQVAQTRIVQPPAIRQDQLPAQSSPATVNAGTYVVWNGGLYYYNTDYDSTRSLTQQPWSQPDPSQPPKYNGISGTAVNINSNGKMTFDTTNNTLTVQKDVLVQKNGSVNSFALVVAPSTYEGGTVQSTVDSASRGSAQVQFTPATSSDTPQLRAPGSITVIGNVVGQGSLVATGLDGSNTIPGDITVVGKSSLDTRTDSGVALYAAGNLNFLQLSQAQAPSAVPAVGNAFGNQGIVPGSGSNGTGDGGGVTPQQKAVYEALAYAILADGPSYSGAGGVAHNTAGNAFEVYNANVTDLGGDISNEAAIHSITVDLPGHPASTINLDTYYRSGATALQYVYKVMELAGVQGLPPGGTLTNADLGNLIAGVGAYGIPPMSTVGGSTVWVPSGSGNTSHVEISLSDMQSFNTTGLPSATPTPSPTATPQASPSPGSVTTAGALDQSFSGLVYAGRDIRIENHLGNLTISGAMAAYGGDPRTDAPGQGGGGNILLAGSSISLQYNPALLGPYAAFFGGQVTVRRNCLTVY